MYCTFTQDVDEFIPRTLFNYEEKEFKNALTDDLGLETEEEKKQAEHQKEASKQTLEFVKETFGDLVKEVRLSASLRSHPVCMRCRRPVSAEMEKYFKKVNPEMAMDAGRILELNAFIRCSTAGAGGGTEIQKRRKKYAKDSLLSGASHCRFASENPTEYTDLVCQLMQ